MSVPSILKLMGTMAGDDPRANDVATAICDLVVEGGKLGELDVQTLIGPDGQTREFKVLPLQWLDRLCRAVEVGAFDRLTVKEIVERILVPLPASESETVSD